MFSSSWQWPFFFSFLFMFFFQGTCFVNALWQRFFQGICFGIWQNDVAHGFLNITFTLVVHRKITFHPHFIYVIKIRSIVLCYHYVSKIVVSCWSSSFIVFIYFSRFCILDAHCPSLSYPCTPLPVQIFALASLSSQCHLFHVLAYNTELLIDVIPLSCICICTYAIFRIFSIFYVISLFIVHLCHLNTTLSSLCSCHCHMDNAHAPLLYCGRIFDIFMSSHCSSLSSLSLMSSLCSCHHCSVYARLLSYLLYSCSLIHSILFVISPFIIVISMPLMSFLCSCHCYVYMHTFVIPIV